MTRTLSASRAAKTLGAAAAGILLIGGAATYSQWTDGGTAPGTDVSAGEITMTDLDCGDAWVYAGTSTSWTPGGDIVPGETISQECVSQLTVVGDEAEAVLAVPTAAFNVGSSNALLSDELQLTSSFATSADNVTYGAAEASPLTVTPAMHQHYVKVTMSIDFPFGAPTTNGSNDDALAAVIDDIAVTLTQVDPNP